MIRMCKLTRGTAALSALGLILVVSGCDKLKSRDNINQGIASFKVNKFADAVDHFKTAIALDPTNANARVYLATAYMQQWIPGADSPENNQMAARAKEEFLKVIEQDPNNANALASLASLAYNQATNLPSDKKMAMFAEASEWYHKVIQADPNSKDAYYSLGVIAWNKWYPAYQLALLNLHMKPEDPGIIKDKKVKEELKAQYTPVIDEGMTDMQKALEIDKEYEDAMTYTNLLIREKAVLLDSPEEYKKQIEIADGWLQKVLDTKKAKAARQPTNNGIVAEPSK
jgi:tetratricopeptide (TPR) repeat protein